MQFYEKWETVSYSNRLQLISQYLFSAAHSMKFFLKLFFIYFRTMFVETLHVLNVCLLSTFICHSVHMCIKYLVFVAGAESHLILQTCCNFKTAVVLTDSIGLIGTYADTRFQKVSCCVLSDLRKLGDFICTVYCFMFL